MDRHSLLGLAPDADEREIKRAFRRLAMRWHPDRNPAPGAVEHFRRLRAAYESLLGEREGKVSGRRGARRHGDARPAWHEDAEPAAAARGADRREEFVLTLEEAFLGCDKQVTIESEVSCETCGGSGQEQLIHTRLCAACHGSGRLRGKKGLVPCGTCGGRGFVNRRECIACSGSGRQRRQRLVSVKVPPGILGGDELRLAGGGDRAPGGEGTPGDLRLRVVIEAHPLYALAGRDLILTRPVSALRMLAGGPVDVPLPGGPRRIELPAGDARPHELRIEGAGFPGRRGQAAGALVVRLEPVFPENPDAEARELIERLDARLARDPKRHWPHLGDWEARWLSGDEPAR